MIWHSTPRSMIEQELGTDYSKGLTAQEVAKRLQTYGPNQLTQKNKKTFLLRFFEQMQDFMVIILIIAAAISAVSTIVEGENDWLEPLVIIAIIILNALLGVIQESRAEAALEALKNMAAPSAKVYRGGSLEVIRASELVPGDIVALEAGDYIPADGRIIEAASLRCEESALTGESVPVEKNPDAEIEDIAGIGDRSNMVYSGCSVAYGRGRVVITETGMNTEMGKIATMLEETSDAITPLQARLAQLGKTLGVLALIICAIIFVVGFFFGDHSLSLGERVLEMFMTSVSLAVAAVPEGLPAIVTIVLAVGVQRMVKKNAIIRRLPAVETLGSASVICSDKTGTLTQNRMTMVKLYNGRDILNLEGELPEDAQMLLKLGSMCCDGRVDIVDGVEKHSGDPTETGIVAAALKYTGLNKDEIDNIYPRMNEIPFDSSRKLMTTVNMIDGRPFAVVKGAPDILLSRCTTGNIPAALEANEAMGREALRVLAVAIKPLEEAPVHATCEELEHDLTFVGLLGMIDPPRPEVFDAIKICNRAGIRAVMITGDHIATATAIARQLGMLTDESQAMTGAQLRELSEEELLQNIEHYSVYARVSPEDKIRIVKAWQQKGHVVAMTGDGVNDAPALKAADIGCAMGITGTDVAKGAAAMTLTDDNFATIVTAVGEGRGIYDNIKKAVHFLLSCNLGEIVTVFVAILVGSRVPGWGVPLSPLMLLWINLVTDSLPALALGMEPVEDDVMDRQPRKKDESMFAGGVGIDVAWQGIMVGVITLIAYGIGVGSHGGTHIYGQTMAFAVLSISQLVHAFNVRSRRSLFKVGFHTNRYMLGAFAGSLLLVLLVLFTPLRGMFDLAALNSTEWLEIIILVLSPLVISEIVKLAKHLYHSRKSS